MIHGNEDVQQLVIAWRVPDQNESWKRRCSTTRYSMESTSAFGVGPLGTNPHSCNQSCLDSGNSQ